MDASDDVFATRRKEQAEWESPTTRTRAQMFKNPLGSGGGYTQDYIDLCEQENLCLKHPERPAVTLPEELARHVVYGSLACAECWPKKEARLRRRFARYTPSGPWWSEWRAKWGEICAYCGGPGRTQDHVVPISQGGVHDYSNLVPACRSCNSSKGARRLWTEWKPSAPVATLLAVFPPPSPT